MYECTSLGEFEVENSVSVPHSNRSQSELGRGGGCSLHSTYLDRLKVSKGRVYLLERGRLSISDIRCDLLFLLLSKKIKIFFLMVNRENCSNITSIGLLCDLHNLCNIDFG